MKQKTEANTTKYTQNYNNIYHCSIQDEDGFFIWTLLAKFFIDSSRASWLPEKYADTALWNNRSCLAITFTFVLKYFN